jgi:hypothetical protein
MLNVFYSAHTVFHRSTVGWMSVLLLGLVMLVPLVALANEGARFPAVRLAALQGGGRLVLPNSAACTFMAIGFNPAKQKQLEQALLRAGSVKADMAAPWKTAEIPVIDLKYQDKAALIETFMKGQVKNKQLLPLVYPYYTNMGQLKRTVQLAPTDETLYLVVNAEGRMVWRQKTAPTVEQLKTAQGACS